MSPPPQVADPPKVKGDVVCPSCGCVSAQVIADGADWHSADASRVHHATVDITAALSSEVRACPAAKSVDAKGESRRRRLLDAYAEIDGAAERLGTSEAIAEAAKEWYTRAMQQKQAIGRVSGRYSKKALVGAVLFVACKDLHAPRSFREIAQRALCSEVSEEAIRREYTRLRSLLSLNARPQVVQRAAPSELVQRICSQLRALRPVPEPLVTLILRVSSADSVCSHLEGRSPASIAAGVVYHVLLHASTTKFAASDVAKAASVSPTTVATISSLLQRAGVVDSKFFTSNSPSSASVAATTTPVPTTTI